MYPQTTVAIEEDQALHFLAGYAIGTTFSQLILSSPRLRENKWAAFFVPTVIAGFAGWAHEWAKPSGDMDDDIIWTGLGGAVGAGFSVSIDF